MTAAGGAAPRVAFLGPAGTFSEEALRASAAGEVDAVPYPRVHETVMAVETGEAERAVVPIENSLEGGVAATLDALASDAPGVRIAGEVIHPIHHCLVAGGPLPLERVERVLSHPQATGQCAGFLRERLPQAESVAVGSTAEAVRTVRDRAGEPLAALGSRLSAELYGCPILAEHVEDRPDNVTRFVWLAPDGASRGLAGASKTSIVFWGRADRSPGWLVEVLREFADRSINLTKIESRPRRLRLGHYMFFLDLDGAEVDEPVEAALDGLRRRVDTLRVLGSYPAAASPGGEEPP